MLGILEGVADFVRRHDHGGKRFFTTARAAQPDHLLFRVVMIPPLCFHDLHMGQFETVEKQAGQIEPVAGKIGLPVVAVEDHPGPAVGAE
jgi:hypothetical protein